MSGQNTLNANDKYHSQVAQNALMQYASSYIMMGGVEKIEEDY